MNPAPNSRTELVSRIRTALPAAHRLFLRFGNCALEVAANREEIISELSSYFHPFLSPKVTADIQVSVHESNTHDLPVQYTVKQPDPGKTKIKEAFYDLSDGRIVRKQLTGMLFVFGGGENIAIGACLANLNQVVNFVNNRYIEWILCRGCILGHAAGVILNGKGIAMAGFSGAGKSTLALQLMNEGATFVSNDRVMIEKSKTGLIMHGVAKMPRINPGTALNNPFLKQIMSNEEQSYFAGLPENELWELEHKYDALIDDCYGPNRFVMSTAMDALVLLNWKRNGNPTTAEIVDLADRRDLLPAFMKNVGLFFLPPGKCAMPETVEEVYIDFLSRCRVLEIRGGTDFAEAANACLELIA
jgi:HprK-related kinase B